MSKTIGIAIGGKATKARSNKLLRAKYTVLRKDTGLCAMIVRKI